MLVSVKIKLLLLTILTISCSVNQYWGEGAVKKRHGRWIEKEVDEDGVYISKGRYNKGEKKGFWRTTYQGKRYFTEKFRKDSTSIMKFYHPNGKLMEMGESRTTITPKYREWKYIGDWKFYDDKGKLLYIKKYENGKKADSTSFR